MRCDEVQSQLMRYVDRRLDEARMRKFDAHLDVCPRCQRHYADEVELAGAFVQEHQLAGGDGLVADVMSRVEREASRRQSDSQRLVRIQPAARVALAVAAAAALLTWWQVGVSSGSGWITSTPHGGVALGLTAVQRAVADGAATLRAALQDGSAALAHGLALGGRLFDTATPGRSTEIALSTLLAAVICVGLVRGFQSRYAKEM